MLIALAFFHKNYENRFKSNWSVILCGAVLFLIGFIPFSFAYNIIVNLVIFFIINFCFATLCFKISFKDSLIFAVLLVAIMFATEMLSIFVFSSVFGIETSKFRNDLTTYIILSSISKLLYLAFSQIIAISVKNKSFKTQSTKRFLPLFIFPIITIISSAVFLLISLSVTIEKPFHSAISIISIFNIIACIFIFIYYQILLEKDEKLNELNLEKNNFTLNNIYLDVLKHQNDELQMLFHDIKHHYMALSSFENIEEVKKYISKIYPEFESKNSLNISSNKILDLILNKYVVICTQKNIDFKIEVKTSNLSYIDESELSVILNNLLDNAVESASRSTEKTIEFSLRSINNMDLLSVINSCDSPPEHISNRLITTKSNSENHGFGTRIISRHAKKNNGKYEWSYDENERKFHSTILFQKSKKSDVN